MNKISIANLNERVKARLKDQLGIWCGFTTDNCFIYNGDVHKICFHDLNFDLIQSGKSSEPNDFFEAMATFDDGQMPMVDNIADSLAAAIVRFVNNKELMYHVGHATTLVFKSIHPRLDDDNPRVIRFSFSGALIPPSEDGGLPYWTSVRP